MESRIFDIGSAMCEAARRIKASWAMWEAKGQAIGNMLVSIEFVLSLCFPFFPQLTCKGVYASLKTPEDLDEEPYSGLTRFQEHVRPLAVERLHHIWGIGV